MERLLESPFTERPQWTELAHLEHGLAEAAHSWESCWRRVWGKLAPSGTLQLVRGTWHPPPLPTGTTIPMWRRMLEKLLNHLIAHQRHSKTEVPNLFWHQGPVSWKKIFPGPGGQGWFQVDSRALYSSSPPAVRPGS